MRREITVGGGHASGQAGWWHFGLGDSPQAEVRVIWPDGTSGDWQAVDSNNFYILARGNAGAAVGGEIAKRDRETQATFLRAPKFTPLTPGAKTCWSRKVSARTAQPSRISGISLGSVSNEMALLCWPPAVMAIASRIDGFEKVEGQRAVPDHRHRRRVDQSKQAAESEAERLAGLAERLALRTVMASRLVGERCDVGVADVGDRRRISGMPCALRQIA